MVFFQTEVGRLLTFWGMIAIPCGLMLVLVWFFRMGDAHMIRRTAIYFVGIFLLLPMAAALIFKSSPSLAKMGFLTFFLIGTAIYFVMTAAATLRPRS